MKSLILNPTDISQWYALVNEAEVATRLILNETTESYLVFLLKRFSQTTQLVDSVMAMDFLESMQRYGRRQIELLRDVGDKSLLLCGLFPGIAERRHVSVDYFASMGQSAYLTASELQDKQEAELYLQLSTHFLMMQHVLEAMRNDLAFTGANNVLAMNKHVQ